MNEKVILLLTFEINRKINSFYLTWQKSVTFIVIKLRIRHERIN